MNMKFKFRPATPEQIADHIQGMLQGQKDLEERMKRLGIKSSDNQPSTPLTKAPESTSDSMPDTTEPSTVEDDDPPHTAQ